MIREELDELQLIISDLGMAMDVKEQIETGEERGLVEFADGESIKVPIPDEVKKQLDDKIKQLSGVLKEKAVRLKITLK